MFSLAVSSSLVHRTISHSPGPHARSSIFTQRTIPKIYACRTINGAIGLLQVQPSVAAQSAASMPVQSCAQQHDTGAPDRSSSAPPEGVQQHAQSPGMGLPDCFQSLSGLKPGVMSACCNSSLGTPGGAPSLASAAANAATADAVRPFIRGSYSYMSKCEPAPGCRAHHRMQGPSSYVEFYRLQSPLAC